MVLSVLTALALFTILHDEAKRAKSSTSMVCCMVFVLAPYLSSSNTSEAADRLSADGMTSLFAGELPIIAALIGAHRLREIAFAQIGGLYGP